MVTNCRQHQLEQCTSTDIATNMSWKPSDCRGRKRGTNPAYVCHHMDRRVCSQACVLGIRCRHCRAIPNAAPDPWCVRMEFGPFLSRLASRVADSMASVHQAVYVMRFDANFQTPIANARCRSNEHHSLHRKRAVRPFRGRPSSLFHHKFRSHSLPTYSKDV